MHGNLIALLCFNVAYFRLINSIHLETIDLIFGCCLINTAAQNCTKREATRRECNTLKIPHCWMFAGTWSHDWWRWRMPASDWTLRGPKLSEVANEARAWFFGCTPCSGERYARATIQQASHLTRPEKRNSRNVCEWNKDRDKNSTRHIAPSHWPLEICRSLFFFYLSSLHASRISVSPSVHPSLVQPLSLIRSQYFFYSLFFNFDIRTSFSSLSFLFNEVDFSWYGYLRSLVSLTFPPTHILSLSLSCFLAFSESFCLVSSLFDQLPLVSRESSGFTRTRELISILFISLTPRRWNALLDLVDQLMSPLRACLWHW